MREILDRLLVSASRMGEYKSPFKPNFEIVPNEDIPNGNVRWFENLSAQTGELATFINGKASGSKYYPAGGFLDWHTNSNNQGIRVYFTYASEDRKGWFKYKINNQIATCWDRIGWNIRLFRVPVWHCVYSECARWSFGFNCQEVPMNLDETLIRLKLV